MNKRIRFYYNVHFRISCNITTVQYFLTNLQVFSKVTRDLHIGFKSGAFEVNDVCRSTYQLIGFEIMIRLPLKGAASLWAINTLIQRSTYGYPLMNLQYRYVTLLKWDQCKLWTTNLPLLSFGCSVAWFLTVIC